MLGLLHDATRHQHRIAHLRERRHRADAQSLADHHLRVHLGLAVAVEAGPDAGVEERIVLERDDRRHHRVDGGAACGENAARKCRRGAHAAHCLAHVCVPHPGAAMHHQTVTYQSASPFHRMREHAFTALIIARSHDACRRPPHATCRRPLREVSLRDLLLSLGPALILIAVAFWIAFKFVQPAPPRQLTIVTGAEGGAYYAFAQRYRSILARDGVTLDIRTSAGSLENLALLMNPDSGVEVGFAQGGSSSAGSSTRIFSLGSIYYEPAWIFLQQKLEIQNIGELRGRRVAVGPDGSGTRVLALQLLSLNGVPLPPTELLYLGARTPQTDSQDATWTPRSSSPLPRRRSCRNCSRHRGFPC